MPDPTDLDPVVVDATSTPTDPLPPPPSKVWTFIRRYVLAPIPIIIVVIVGVLAAAAGMKNFQIGGIIGKLLGKKGDGKRAIEVANSVPEGRVREDGSIIEIGESDSRGMTQAHVVPLEKPGLFDDPKKLKIKPPGEEKAIEVDVPEGVKAKDVKRVVVVRPHVYAVEVKSDSKIEAKDVDDLLSKYKNI